MREAFLDMAGPTMSSIPLPQSWILTLCSVSSELNTPLVDVIMTAGGKVRPRKPKHVCWQKRHISRETKTSHIPYTYRVKTATSKQQKRGPYRPAADSGTAVARHTGAPRRGFLRTGAARAGGAGAELPRLGAEGLAVKEDGLRQYLATIPGTSSRKLVSSTQVSHVVS